MKTGIFSGTFDPVHAGHIEFALEAVKSGGLDEVYFIPEPHPRRKYGVTHYAHRVAMLRLALRPYQKLKLLELPDKQFSVSKSLPRIKKMFKDSNIYLLVGTDVLRMLDSPDASTQWPGYEQMLQVFDLIVGVRSGAEKTQAQASMKQLQVEGIAIETSRPNLSSRDIRNALMKGRQHKDLLVSLRKYVKQNWLYASTSTESNIS